jgi:hypothetical protein
LNNSSEKDSAKNEDVSTPLAETASEESSKPSSTFKKDVRAQKIELLRLKNDITPSKFFLKIYFKFFFIRVRALKVKNEFQKQQATNEIHKWNDLVRKVGKRRIHRII